LIETSEVRVDLGDHGVLSIPYVNVVGEAGGGPHLTVIAGVHGTEYTSIAAARALLAELRPAELSGTVTVSPVIGGTPTRITAPAAGVPLFITSSPAVCADGLLLGLARPVKTT
jgi:predicted deacylase